MKPQIIELKDGSQWEYSELNDTGVCMLTYQDLRKHNIKKFYFKRLPPEDKSWSTMEKQKEGEKV